MEEPQQQQEIPRNADAQKKFDDPKYHEKMDWIGALEKDYPEVPYYFLDLITSFVQANPDEAEAIMTGSVDHTDFSKIDEWRTLAKK